MAGNSHGNHYHECNDVPTCLESLPPAWRWPVPFARHRPAWRSRVPAKAHPAKPEPPQDTGFLNRSIELHGITYRFQVYLPEDWRRDDGKQWPIILFLHGRGERGSEGMWQTQIGLRRGGAQPSRPLAVRHRHAAVPANRSLDRSRHAGTGHGRARPGVGGVSWRPGAHLSHRPLHGRIRRMGTGAPVSASLGRHRHCRRRRLLELRAGALAGGLRPARRICARGGPHAGLALPRQPRPHGGAAPERADVRRLQGCRRQHPAVDLPGLKHDCWTRAYDEPELPRWLLAHRTPPGTGGRWRSGS